MHALQCRSIKRANYIFPLKSRGVSVFGKRKVGKETKDEIKSMFTHKLRSTGPCVQTIVNSDSPPLEYGSEALHARVMHTQLLPGNLCGYNPSNVGSVAGPTVVVTNQARSRNKVPAYFFVDQ